MTTLLITGVLYQPFGSFPLITRSNDGESWDSPSVPFDSKNTSPTCISTSTDGSTIIIASGNGDISVTTDLETFSFSTISDGFYPAGMIYVDTSFMACGQIIYTSSYGPYDSMSEVAQIYKADLPGTLWTMIWSHPLSNSRLYQIKTFLIDSITVIVACGSVNGNGDAWYSLDEGFSWNQVLVPENVGPILSVDTMEISGTLYYYWGSIGSLYRSTGLDGTAWAGVPIEPNDHVVSMINDGSTLVAVGQTNVYYTSDGLYFKKWNYPGYVFDHVGYINGKWIVFARSTLTRYTQWITENFIDWTPSNNGVHVSGVASFP